MQPGALSRESFQAYQPMARRVASEHLELLRELPLVLCAVMLREVIDFDVRFPRERTAIESRLAFLEKLAEAERNRLTNGFADLSLSSELAGEDWVRFPHKFEEDLSAHLWASKQYDTFRSVATSFAREVDRATSPQQPEVPRWVVVVLGPELRKEDYPLFRKLRPHGVFFPSVDGAGGMTEIVGELSKRASSANVPYGHWYVDGGGPENTTNKSIHRFSWEESAALRAKVLEKVESVVGSGRGGPEMLRSAMATWSPQKQVSMTGDLLVDRFIVSVYGEGSGTQVFSTTFVQWATRELLRRAEPVSVVARYGPRQKQRTLNEMFSANSAGSVLDPAGSLVDADFGAYSTWINLNRLAGSDNARFIAWSQAHRQAIAIGPDCPRGTEAPGGIDVGQLLRI